MRAIDDAPKYSAECACAKTLACSSVISRMLPRSHLLPTSSFDIPLAAYLSSSERELGGTAATTMGGEG